MTAQGHPRSVYRRAIERGNLLVAEATLRELGRPTLGELLELTLLIGHKDPRRYPRVAARWLTRYLQERDEVTIYEAAFATACLHAIAGPSNAQASAALRELVRAEP